MKLYYPAFILLTLASHSIYAEQACNAKITNTTPGQQFTVNGQEITDKKTGLTWQKCTLGQSENDCSGNSQTYTWSEALQAANTKSQQTGKSWRLPNVKELLSITEEPCYDPSINITLFPNTNPSAYWTASPSASDANKAWSVRFDKGFSDDDITKNTQLSIRLVR